MLSWEWLDGWHSTAERMGRNPSPVPLWTQLHPRAMGNTWHEGRGCSGRQSASVLAAARAHAAFAPSLGVPLAILPAATVQATATVATSKTHVQRPPHWGAGSGLVLLVGAGSGVVLPEPTP